MISPSTTEQKLLLLIDGNALVHRGFHALPPLTTKDGTMVNAVYGFTTTLLKAISDFHPSHIAVAFDKRGKTFRHEAYEEYKATREKAPDELYAQFPLIKDLVRAFNIPIQELDGYEADDVIGSIAKQSDTPVLIVTGDNDALQLVDNNINVYTFGRGLSDAIIYDPEKVADKYGFGPELLPEYKGLRGDSSDNIPGVKGIGEKTATIILQEIGSLEELNNIIDQVAPLDKKERKQKLADLGLSEDAVKAISRGKTIDTLAAQKDLAKLSKRLGTIVTDIELDFDIKDAKTSDFHRDQVLDLFDKYEFKSLKSRIPASNKFGDIASTADTSKPPVTAKTQTNPDQSALFDTGATASTTDKPTPDINGEYRTIDTKEALSDLIATILMKKTIAVDTETATLDQTDPHMVGISIAHTPGEAFYIPVDHAEGQQIKRDELFSALKPILEHPDITKVGHNIKYDIAVFKSVDIHLAGPVLDTMIAYYTIGRPARTLSLDALAESELEVRMQPITDLIGEGTPKNRKNQIPFTEVPIHEATHYAAEDADITLRLWELVEPQIKEKNATVPYYDIDIPLIPVLERMEAHGVMLDTKFLAKLSTQFTNTTADLEKKIHDQAGTFFNVKSTQQLSSILFDTLGLPKAGIKKTKSGYSTAASELEKLKGKHEIIDLISEYREVEKLRNTYVDTLPELVHPSTGRIHTNYNQTIAATGRLSSTDPNLQNIPIRTDLGREIRKAFIAPPNHKLLALDYSQIELRIAAHLANEKAMIEAFESGADIHTATAALVFSVPESEVTSDQRRTAKAVNFGILYGMSAWGIQRTTGLPIDEANEILATYFSSYPSLYQYTQDVVEEAKAAGYAETMYGRRRYIPELKSTNYQLRQTGQRMAINMPIQGSQADIVKLAMIAIDARLRDRTDVHMILQVHDELIFEVADTSITEIANLCREEMESAATLRVPLVVEAKVGPTWGDTEPISFAD